ncbi:BppU family phage baseplate upper protein [Polynucleobacter sp. UK-Kesae-W10]|uniref:BppU family phage baseplate upper protein n=1 Tax=Polynucleobacter sp. UK-Kesae-W10 TaxID=1819738 RepID=UPI001C0B3EE6|nr:BppU family phage baseplate upper protein [Polynucleobacter sp. UK-Kesae-W10]MBU3577580.1 BppU family phage baseplate upper protein [Polynucleobacter sp. UK-Kesae-W10]
MAEKIKLVQGDSRPQVQATLTDDTTGVPIDITRATVVLKFRVINGTTILSTLPGYITDAANGKVCFTWPPGSLDVAPGQYEGEIEITFEDTTVQTVYDTLKFIVRAQF